MTTQTKGVPAIPPALPNVSEQQIRQENAEAAAASGYTSPEQNGVSDNLSPPPLPEVVNTQLKDKIKAGQQQAADDREDFMADIARKRREHEASQADGQPEDAYGVDIDSEVDDNQPQEQETQVAQEVQTSQDGSAQVADDQPRFFTAADGSRKVELLVNGQKMVVDEARVLVAAQKLEAGDERLREAAFQRQQLIADRQQLERDRAALQIQQPSATDADQNLRQQLRDGFDRMYNSGDETALDGLVDVIMQGRQQATPQIDTRQIADQVTADLNQKAWNDALQNDVAAYESDSAFSDITGNPVFSARAANYAKQYMLDHPEVRTSGTTPRQVMNHCAQIVRDEVAVFSQGLNVQPTHQPQVQQAQSRADVVEQRKTQAGNTVVSGGTQRAENTQRTVAQDGGRSPTSMDAKVAAFAGLQADRTQSVVRR